MITVAFQGELGAFSEEAVHRFFGEGVTPVPRRGFAEVGQAVTAGGVDFGLLPIENSLAGSVLGSYDVLSDGALAVLGEVVTPIHHCLLGLPGSGMEEAREHAIQLCLAGRHVLGLLVFRDIGAPGVRRAYAESAGGPPLELFAR